MNAQEFISNEMDIRVKLINDPKFIELCVNAVKEMGISAKEWNENRMNICLYFANEIIAKDNKSGSTLRANL